MHFVPPREAALIGPWEELAGPFPTLHSAEVWIDSPPDDLGDPGTITLSKTGGYFYVYSLGTARRSFAA